MSKFAAMFGGGAVDTFFGLPPCPDLGALEADIAILGAGSATPYATVGAYCAAAPGALRAATADYASNFGHMNFDLGGPVLPEGVAAADCGDISLDEADPEASRDAIFAAVAQVLDRGAVPVLIGGDDFVQTPMIRAYAGRGDHVILQIDAHIDWRDEVAGERLGLSSTMRRASEQSHIARIVQVGARGIGSARVSDVEEAKAAGVEFVLAREVARDGIGRAVSLIPEGAEVIICFDLDALDPAIMPGVIGRTGGGLSYWDVMDLVKGVAARARIAGLGMVEFMPERDVDGLGAQTAAQLLAGLLGLVARQR